MKHLWIILLYSGIWITASAAPTDNRSIRLINKESGHSPDGSYYYKYNFDNGVMEMVHGKLKQVNTASVYNVVGSYEIPSGDGRVLVVDYIADENGYHAMVSLGGGIRPKRPTTTDAIKMASFLREFHRRYFRRKFLIF